MLNELQKSSSLVCFCYKLIIDELLTSEHGLELQREWAGSFISHNCSNAWVFFGCCRFEVCLFCFFADKDRELGEANAEIKALRFSDRLREKAVEEVMYLSFEML